MLSYFTFEGISYQSGSNRDNSMVLHIVQEILKQIEIKPCCIKVKKYIEIFITFT